MRLKDVVVTAGGLVFQQAAQFLVGIYIARSLGATAYGGISVARNIVALLALLAPLGLDLALLKYLPAVEARGGNIHARFAAFRRLAFAVNLAVVAAMILAAPYIERDVLEDVNPRGTAAERKVDA